MQLKKLLTPIIKIFIGALIIAYPFIVFFAFKTGMAIRFIGLFLLSVVVLSFLRNKNRFLFGIGLFVCFLILCFNQDIFLKIYPVLMNATVCAMFALSLKKTPLVTQYAQKMHKNLDKYGIKYTRNATLAWAVFMGCNTLISLATVFMQMNIWVLYNGFISYILIGLMMISEYILRKWFLRV